MQSYSRGSDITIIVTYIKKEIISSVSKQTASQPVLVPSITHQESYDLKGS